MEKSEQQKVDEMYMRRALQLARSGRAGAAPNPMVGAVIVARGRIIGEGFHRRCGGPHAEVNAVRSVREVELLPESTIYVTLEPCAHYGKTPPCADLIVEKQIPRIVVGCRDSFDKVDGKGVRRLRNAGREVVVGVLEEECLALNRAFFTFHSQQRPYVLLKWAQTSDGFVDYCREKGDGKAALALSTPITKTLMHALRAHSDAILVGGSTALLDNPSLTTRLYPGASPVRVVLDTHDSLPRDLQMFMDGLPTLVYGKEPLLDVLRDLYAKGIQRLMVEGGPQTLQRFLDEGLWDEVRVEIAPLKLGQGVIAPALPCRVDYEEEMIDGNRILRAFSNL